MQEENEHEVVFGTIQAVNDIIDTEADITITTGDGRVLSAKTMEHILQPFLNVDWTVSSICKILPLDAKMEIKNGVVTALETSVENEST